MMGFIFSPYRPMTPARARNARGAYVSRKKRGPVSKVVVSNRLSRHKRGPEYDDDPLFVKKKTNRIVGPSVSRKNDIN